jgi:hypothetical protein
MIGFVFDQDQVRFEINLDAATQARLQAVRGFSPWLPASANSPVNRASNAFSHTSRNPHPENSGRMAGSMQLSKSAVRAARNSRLTGA